MGVADRAHVALIEAMTLFAQRTELGFAERIGGATVVVTGLRHTHFNAVAVTGRATADEMQHAVESIGAAGLPWSVMLRKDRDAAHVDLVRAAGLSPDPETVPLMAAVEPAPSPWPDELDLVTGPWTIAMHRALICDAFGMEKKDVDALVTDDLAAHPSVDIVVGTLDGLPVTTALAVRVDDAVAIFNVGTTSDVRGRGYGSAATWAAMAPAFESGATLATLQTSRMGRGVYEGLGYEVVATHEFWIDSASKG